MTRHEQWLKQQSLLVHLMVRRLLGRPLAEILRAMEGTSGGDLSARAEVARRDELGVIANGLNAMLDQLEQFNAEAGPANAGIGFAQIHTAELDKLLSSAGHTAQEIVDAIDKDLKPRSFALPDSVNVKLEVEVARDRKTANNVVAYLPGETDEFVILGAHYDHLGLGGPGSLAPALTGTVHHGADDNASGTAGVMDVCRAGGIPSRCAFLAPSPSPPRRGLTDQPPLVAEFALPAETLSAANCSES